MSRTAALPYVNISNAEELDRLGFSVDFHWFDGNGQQLIERAAPDIIDGKELEGFLPRMMSVRLEVNVTIRYPNMIFGTYVSNDAELGLALQYQFEKIGDQKAIPFPNCTIINSSSTFTASLTHIFPKSTFRGRSDFWILLYVKNPGTENVCFAKNAGAIIGRIDGRAIITGGSGYVFSPCLVAKGKDDPLWWIESTITEDTLENPLDTEFKVFINTDNRSFPSLFLDSAYFSPLKLELFSSVCAQLIESVRRATRESSESWDLEEDAEGDSVLSHVRYFARRFLPDQTEQFMRTAPYFELANIVRHQLSLVTSRRPFVGDKQ